MKTSLSEHRHLVLIPLVALAAVMPLIYLGCSCGHDFDFHLLNWMEVARQFSQGNLHPHWAFTPAFNAGEPRFIFYPPLSWTLGALIGLLLTHLPGVTQAAAWTATPIVFTWIALTLSGLTLHRLARIFVGSNAALLAATLYVANPYMLFTAYERTAYAELLAAAWIPLLFHAILSERVTIPRIAVPIALLWLTNAPAAVMGSYTLALLAVVRVSSTYRKEVEPATTRAELNTSDSQVFGTWVSRHRSSLHLAFNIFAGTSLGLALAAFYIVPAAYERRYVQIAMATVAGMRIDQNFLFEHTGNSSDALLHDQVLRTASLIAILLLAATAVALAITLVRTKSGTPRLASEPVDQHRDGFPILPLAILTTGIAFLLTPLSLQIWNHAPQAAFLQFPWRLLAILAPVFALATAAAIYRLSLKFAPTAITAIVLAVVLGHVAYLQFHQPCDPEDTASARLALFSSREGTDPTDEYTPTTADNDALTPNDPPYWLAPSPTDPPPSASQLGPAPMHLTITASRAEDLILNLRDYPAWHITLNGLADRSRAPRPDGLIAVPIPAGPSTIDIRYAHTVDQTIGDTTTLVAFIFFLFTLRSSKAKEDGTVNSI
jgi:hypothetical protein